MKLHHSPLSARRSSTLVALCAASALSSFGALAQAQDTARDSSYSWLPGTRQGYVGLNLGRIEYNTNCGFGTFSCEDAPVGGRLFVGGLFNEWLGMEVGLLSLGEADRSGGRTRAQGVNVSALLRAPFGSFNVFAKGGATYGRTRVSASALSGVPSGKADGWGASYGAGVGYDFTPRSGMRLEWEQHDMRFPGTSGRQNVRATTLGYVHRF